MTTALFRLVFQVTGRDTRGEHLLHHHLHMTKAAVSVFHIHHERERIDDFAFAHILFTHPVIAGANHTRGLFAEFIAAEDTHIRDAVLFHRIRKPAQVGGLKTGMRRKLHALGIIEARRENVGLVVEQTAQNRTRVSLGKAEFGKPLFRGFGGGRVACHDVVPAFGCHGQAP